MEVLPSSRLISTSCPASVLLLVRHTSVPPIHVSPCPVSASRVTTERALPHGDDARAHTPRRLDRWMSMARSELTAMPLRDGFSRMQSSSGHRGASARSFSPSPGGCGACSWCCWWALVLLALRAAPPLRCG